MLMGIQMYGWGSTHVLVDALVETNARILTRPSNLGEDAAAALRAAD